MAALMIERELVRGGSRTGRGPHATNNLCARDKLRNGQRKKNGLFAKRAYVTVFG